MSKRRSPDARSVGDRASVAYQVITVIALGPSIAPSTSPSGITRPQLTLKVRNQGFDIVHGAVLHGRSGRGDDPIYTDPRAYSPALLDDPEALPNLFDAHYGAIITIAGSGGRNIELELVVSAIRLPLAKFPFESAGAKVGTGHAPFDRFISAESADALCARLEIRFALRCGRIRSSVAAGTR